MTVDARISLPTPVEAARRPARPAPAAGPSRWHWGHVLALTAVLAVVAYLVNERVDAFQAWPFIGVLQ